MQSSGPQLVTAGQILPQPHPMHKTMQLHACHCIILQVMLHQQTADLVN
jgi:hypothetical protein